MPSSKKEVEASLSSKGFRWEERDHHYFIYWTIEGRKSPINTKVSHSSKKKEIHDGLLSQMAKQCRLTNREFRDLIACPLNRERYERILVERGEL